MLQRDNRAGNLGRPSLFAEAPDALGEDKNILKQLDGALAASAGVTSGMRRKRGIVGALLVLCAVAIGLAWAFGQADRPPDVVRAEALAPPQAAAPAPTVPARAPTQPAEPAPVAAPVASPAAGAASAAGTATLPQATVTQPRAADQLHGQPHRHAARTARGKAAAAADRHGHKAKTKAAAGARQSEGARAKARGKDRSVAHAQHKSASKRQEPHVRKATRRDARGGTRDSDAALLEALLVHGGAFGAAKGKGAAAAGHCDPVKGDGAGRGHHVNSCSTQHARKPRE